MNMVTLCFYAAQPVRSTTASTTASSLPLGARAQRDVAKSFFRTGNATAKQTIESPIQFAIVFCLNHPRRHWV